MIRLLLSSQCERALTLWCDDLLKYENGSLKMTRTSAQHDFSGTNYRSCTLGWLAGIQQKHRTDKKFFERICNEAHEIALHSMSKGKQLDGSQADQYSDCNIADRAGIQSDKSDEEVADNQTGVPRSLQGPEKGEGYLNVIDVMIVELECNTEIYGNGNGESSRSTNIDQSTDFYGSDMDEISDLTALTQLEESDDESHAGDHCIL